MNAHKITNTAKSSHTKVNNTKGPATTASEGQQEKQQRGKNDTSCSREKIKKSENKTAQNA